ncbi:hypothetical protein [Duganella sp. Root198D2]|uniref:hypothetical protein n=2 Tax=unclassified Duganella TaxID=2636909 RepID=UPI001910F797|nr:hypothetical protein [Duganella sp. Root198D2]
MPNADYDSAWKQAIELYWPDFTELFLLEEWGCRPAPESQDQELAKCSRDSNLGLFRVDKLLRAPGVDGQPYLWHIEIQAARQRGFAQRMFVCQYRLYEHFQLPMRSIAILGDHSPTWRPCRFELAAGNTRTTFDFETIKLRDFEDRLAELLLSDNVFAWLVVAHLFTLRTRKEPLERAIVKAKLLTGLRTCGWTRKKSRDVFDLIERMMTLTHSCRLSWKHSSKFSTGGWKWLGNIYGKSALNSVEWNGVKQGGRQLEKRGGRQLAKRGGRHAVRRAVKHAAKFEAKHVVDWSRCEA